MPQAKDTDWLNEYKNKTHMLSTRDHFRFRDIYRLKVRGWKKLLHANANQKLAEVTIFIIKQNRL